MRLRSASKPCLRRTSKAGSIFLSIPIEIRLKTYKHYSDGLQNFPVLRFRDEDEDATWVPRESRSFSPIAPLMFTCKQVYGECRSDLTNMRAAICVVAVGLNPTTAPAEAAQLRLNAGQTHTADKLRFTLIPMHIPLADKEKVRLVDDFDAIQATVRTQLCQCYQYLRFFKIVSKLEYCFACPFPDRDNLHEFMKEIITHQMDDGAIDLEKTRINIGPHQYPGLARPPDEYGVNMEMDWIEDRGRMLRYERRLEELREQKKAGIAVLNDHVCSFGCFCRKVSDPHLAPDITW